MFSFALSQERHRTSSALTEAIQASTNTSQSNRLKQALKMTPRLLDVYFSAALQDVNDCMLFYIFIHFLFFSCWFSISSLFLFVLIVQNNYLSLQI